MLQSLGNSGQPSREHFVPERLGEAFDMNGEPLFLMRLRKDYLYQGDLKRNMKTRTCLAVLRSGWGHPHLSTILFGSQEKMRFWDIILI